MRIGLYAKKIGMTRVFAEDGVATPVTVLEVEPSVVMQVKTAEKDGYSALQLGYGSKKLKKVNKAQSEAYNKAGLDAPKHVYEARADKDLESIAVGDKLGIDNFEGVNYVDLTAKTKGKGFQGVMKRHNFAGGRASHGDSTGRRTGSIGQSASPSRVFPGVKGPGRMGGKIQTVQNVKVHEVDLENNLLLLAGAVPGPKNGVVKVSVSLKKGNDAEVKVIKPAEKKETVEVAAQTDAEQTDNTNEENNSNE